MHGYTAYQRRRAEVAHPHDSVGNSEKDRRKCTVLAHIQNRVLDRVKCSFDRFVGKTQERYRHRGPLKNSEPGRGQLQATPDQRATCYKQDRDHGNSLAVRPHVAPSMPVSIVSCRCIENAWFTALALLAERKLINALPSSLVARRLDIRGACGVS